MTIAEYASNLPASEPYIIAEAGVNHEGSMEIAKRMIHQAQQAGADAIKFQTYRAETIAAVDSPAYWDTSMETTRSQFELFRKYDKFWKAEYEQLSRECDDAGIQFLSTPFDAEAVDFLDPLVSVFKVASADITNKPLLEQIGSKGKPVLLSTGAAYYYEIAEAMHWLQPYGVPVALLHCVLSYPAVEASAHLAEIRQLSRRFPDCAIGYSDHVPPNDGTVLTTAYLLGARIIEKHFTLDKALPGNDHYHAMDPDDLRAYREMFRRIIELVGDAESECHDAELGARRHARRSIVAARPIHAGTTIKATDIIPKRPGHGISPKDIDMVIGRTARVEIPTDTILDWKHLGGRK